MKSSFSLAFLEIPPIRSYDSSPKTQRPRHKVPLQKRHPWVTRVWHARFSLILHTHSTHSTQRPQSRALRVVRYQRYRVGHVAIRRYCHPLRASGRLLQLRVLPDSNRFRERRTRADRPQNCACKNSGRYPGSIVQLSSNQKLYTLLQQQYTPN